jgi:hypothetical protein
MLIYCVTTKYLYKSEHLYTEPLFLNHLPSVVLFYILVTYIYIPVRQLFLRILMQVLSLTTCFGLHIAHFKSCYWTLTLYFSSVNSEEMNLSSGSKFLSCESIQLRNKFSVALLLKGLKMVREDRRSHLLRGGNLKSRIAQNTSSKILGIPV